MTLTGTPASASARAARSPSGVHGTFTTTLAAQVAAPVLLRGDFNFDGKLTSADVDAFDSMMKKTASFMAKHKLNKEQMLALGDFTGDGRLTTADRPPLLAAIAAASSTNTGTNTNTDTDTSTGTNTNTEMLCGVYIDPKTLEVYVTNNDTVNWMPVFSR